MHGNQNIKYNHGYFVSSAAILGPDNALAPSSTRTQINTATFI